MGVRGCGRGGDRGTFAPEGWARHATCLSLAHTRDEAGCRHTEAPTLEVNMRISTWRTLLTASSLAASLALFAPAQVRAQATTDTTVRTTDVDDDDDTDFGWIGLLGLLGLAGLRRRPAPVVHETVRTTGTSDPSMRR